MSSGELYLDFGACQLKFMSQSLCTSRLKSDYELELRAKRGELEAWEARLKAEEETVRPLKLDNKKLVSELSEQRLLVEKLQTQLHEATWSASKSGAQKTRVSEKQPAMRWASHFILPVNGCRRVRAS